MRRQISEKSSSLLKELKQAEKQHKASPTEPHRLEVHKIRTSLEALQMQQVERAIRKLKTIYYRQGNR
ncbi:Hypothetical predicted protein, partial [Pelobates cultripes]